jgi:hypothetical protein
MAINIDSWNTNETLNGTLEGQDVSEGSLPGPLNNVIRRMAAAIRAFRDQAYCKDKHVTIQASGGAAPAAPVDGDLWLEYTP